MKLFNRLKRQFLVALFFLTSLAISAQTTTYTGIGNWSDAGNWSNGIPDQYMKVIISSGSGISIDVANAACSSLTFTDNSTSIISVNILGTNTLTVSNWLNMNKPSTNSTHLLQVGDGTVIVNGTLVMNNSGSDAFKTIVTINNGTLQTNNLDLTNTGYLPRKLITFTGTGLLDIKGNVTKMATINAGNGTISFSGSGDQTMFESGTAGIGLNNLTVSGGGTKKMGGDYTINKILNLNGAILQLGGYKLSLAGNGNIVPGQPYSATNMLETNSIGYLARLGNQVSQFQIEFPIGSNGVYAPLNIVTLTTPPNGSFNIKTTTGKNPFITGNNYIARSWNIDGVLNQDIADGFFVYGDADIVGTEMSITKVAKLASGAITEPAYLTVDPAQNKIKITNSGSISLNSSIFACDAYNFTPGTVYSIANGSWTTTSTWSSNSVPNVSTNVIVFHNVSGTTTAKDLYIAPGAKVDPNSNSQTINGNVIVDGQWYDTHGGGTNIYRGNITVNNGGQVNWTGNVSNSNATIAGSIINNGRFNFSVAATNSLKFNGTTDQYLSGTMSITFNGTGSTMTVECPNLIIDNSYPGFPAVQLVGNITLGTPQNALPEIKVINRSRVYIDGAGSGRINASAPGTEIRKWLNDDNSYLKIQTNAIGSAELDADQIGNTVEYWNAGGSTIKSAVYYNLAIGGDRHDRYKTFQAGSDFNILGNLIIQNNGSWLQFGSEGQKVNVGGDVIIEGNGNFITTGGKSNTTELTIGGGIRYNGTTQASPFNLYSTNVIFTGSSNTNIFSGGTKEATFYSLTLQNSLDYTSSGQQITLNKNFTNNAKSFTATAGKIYLPEGTTKSFNGTSILTKFNTLELSWRNDRNLTVNQYIPLVINTFNIIPDGGVNHGKYYLNGNSLTVTSKYNVGKSSTVSALVSDANASISLISGCEVSNGFVLAAEGNTVKNLVFETSNTVVLFGDVSVTTLLDLDLGYIANGTAAGKKIFLTAGAKIDRGDGFLVAPVAGGAAYDVDYTNTDADITVGAEANTNFVATINLNSDRNVIVNTQPIVNNALIITKGAFVAPGSGYIKIPSFADIRLAATNGAMTALPVGTLTKKTILGYKVSALTSPISLKISDMLNPNTPANTNNNVKKYVTVSGTQPFNFDMEINYLVGDVVGSEGLLFGQKYVSSTWTKLAAADAVNHKVLYTITEPGEYAIFGDGTQGIAEKSSSDFGIYPNPAKAQLFVRGLDVQTTAHICDLTGKVILSQQISNGQAINVASLKTGVYFVKINTKTMKFVKE